MTVEKMSPGVRLTELANDSFSYERIVLYFYYIIQKRIKFKFYTRIVIVLEKSLYLLRKAQSITKQKNHFFKVWTTFFESWYSNLLEFVGI